MNKKEAENIAWELSKIIEPVSGPQASMVIANAAIEAVDNIREMSPKIDEALKEIAAPVK